MKRVLIVLTVASVLVSATTVRAVTPTTCALIKQKAAGKKAAAELNCYSKAAKGAVPVDIALVPRPSHGLIYAGRVVGPFELLDMPPWYERYMQIRGDMDLSQSTLQKPPLHSESCDAA